jgi:hypothetical protein
MYEILDAHFLTVFIIVGSIMVTPIYIMAVYVFSGASSKKGLQIGSAFLIWGSFMVWACLSQISAKLGLLGNLVVPIAWILPSLILFWQRSWFLSQKLSQKWLVGLQLFRVIGGVFLIEMVRGHIPGVFAYPAGVGDILVGMVAFGILLACNKRQRVPGAFIVLVIVLGIADFISAFFFGFTSTPGPFQLFFPAIPNRLLVFPTGMIPLFLVPYAIFFHTLSLLNYLKFDQFQQKEAF